MSENAIRLDATGNAYVVGYTDSTDFPTTGGAFQTNKGNNLDGFVAKLDATGAALVYSTYLGSSHRDEADAIAVDSVGNAYVAGLTESSDFPITQGSPQPIAPDYPHLFVTKLNAAGSALISSSHSNFLAGFDFNTGI